jgi:hypothetical protein
MWFFRWTTVLLSVHVILVTSRLSRNTALLPSMALSERVDLLGLDLAGNNVWLALSMLTFLIYIVSIASISKTQVDAIFSQVQRMDSYVSKPDCFRDVASALQLR